MIFQRKRNQAETEKKSGKKENKLFNCNFLGKDMGMKGHGDFLEHLLLLGIFLPAISYERKENIQAEKEQIYFLLARK